MVCPSCHFGCCFSVIANFPIWSSHLPSVATAGSSNEDFLLGHVHGVPLNIHVVSDPVCSHSHQQHVVLPGLDGLQSFTPNVQSAEAIFTVIVSNVNIPNAAANSRRVFFMASHLYFKVS